MSGFRVRLGGPGRSEGVSLRLGQKNRKPFSEAYDKFISRFLAAIDFLPARSAIMHFCTFAAHKRVFRVSVIAKADRKVQFFNQSRIWVLCKTTSESYEVTY